MNHQHEHMSHGGGMDMPSGQPMCNMNMLFTWDTTNLCIIFHWWRITNALTLLISLAAIAVLTAGYEAVREASRRYEASSQEYANTLPRKGVDDHEKRIKVVKAAFYAVQVFYSFFIMLLFMTYNGWIMLAVTAGAFIGYLGFGNSSATKSVACH